MAPSVAGSGAGSRPAVSSLVALVVVVCVLVVGGAVFLGKRSLPVRVEIKNLQFNPDSIAVPLGAMVLWVNSDIVPHNVTTGSNAWTSPTLYPGDSLLVEMTEKGPQPYTCTFHPGMSGSVEVGGVQVGSVQVGGAPVGGVLGK